MLRPISATVRFKWSIRSIFMVGLAGGRRCELATSPESRPAPRARNRSERGIIVGRAVGGEHRVTDDEIRRSLQREIGFLRGASVELRRIALRAPEVADELRRLADQFDRDAEDLGKRFPGLGPP